MRVSCCTIRPRKTCVLLWSYLERYGRPVSFYTDKASLFQTAPKIARDLKELPRDEREPLPPTQIGRALAELGIVWIAAHSPQAKGRVERSFQTAQDRLVKGLRVAGAKTLEQANAYLETEFLPWWNQTLAVVPASADDAHRPLGKDALAGGFAELCRNPTSEQRLHDPVRQQDLPDRPRRYSCRPARSRRAGRSPARRINGGSLPRPLPDGQPNVTARPKASPAPKARQAKAQPSGASRPKSQWMKNFHLYDSGKGRSIGTAPAAARARGKTHSVGRAKAARPSSRFLYPKPPLLRDFTKVSSFAQKTKTLRTGSFAARLTEGLPPLSSEPAPSRLGLGSAPGARPPAEPSHSKPQPLHFAPQTGHFYLAENRTFLFGVDR